MSAINPLYTYEEQIKAVMKLAGVAGLKFALVKDQDPAEKIAMKTLARALYEHAKLLDDLNKSKFVPDIIAEDDLLKDDLVFTERELAGDEEATKISTAHPDATTDGVKQLLIKNNTIFMTILDAKTVAGEEVDDSEKIDQLIKAMVVKDNPLFPRWKNIPAWNIEDIVTNREANQPQKKSGMFWQKSKPKVDAKEPVVNAIKKDKSTTTDPGNKKKLV